MLSVNILTAQNNVGIGTLTPNNSAMLDIVASDKGVLIPRVALTAVNTPINAPATGLMVYNTSTSGTYSTPGFYYFDGSNWVQIGSGGTPGPVGPAGPTGPIGPAGPTSIQSLTISGNDLTISGANTVTLPTSGGGTTYTAGTGISITGNTIANTLPNTIQTLTLNVSTLTLSGGGGSVVLPSSGGGGTLDNAYDFGGLGAGRTITADNGSVTINGSGTGAAGIALMVNQTGTNTAGIGSLINGTGTGNAINAVSSNASNAFAVIQAETNSSTLLNSAVFGLSTAAAKGVTGEVSSTSSATSAVYGNSLKPIGGTGVEGNGFNGTAGIANNRQGYGVFGQNTQAPNASFDAVGVVGIGGVGMQGQTQTPGVFAGIVADNLSTFTSTTAPAAENFGLLATANSGNGVLGQTLNQYGVGVAGTNFSTGIAGNCLGVYGSSTWIGVRGETSDPSGYGVHSLGNFAATGTKAFIIDHPLDPTNKYLKHFSIESDEVLNVYRGTIVLDANGDATVELPTYFKEININFSYQLTAIGSAAPNIFVKEEIVGNTFKVSGGNANQKISWTVYAERNDIFLQKYPENRNTEVDKRAVDKGTYQHPELYGLPKKEQKQVKTNGQATGKQLELTK